MPDITVHRHADRWSVVERGAESPLEEFPTREAAEAAARQMAAGGSVEVLEDDPTGLDHDEVPDGGAPGPDAGDRTGVGPGEGVRDPQPGL